jgi:hypothetical protein
LKSTIAGLKRLDLGDLSAILSDNRKRSGQQQPQYSA